MEEWEKPESITLGCADYQSVVRDQGILYNNVWNKDAAGSFPWRQCLEQKPGTDTVTLGWSWQWPDKGRQIFGYPQIKRGSSPWDPIPKIDDQFPIPIARLKSMTIAHDLTIAARGQHNVATSLWLTRTPAIGTKPDPTIIAAEVMVWTYATDGHMDPAGKKIGTIWHAQQRWSVWLDKNWTDASGQNDNRWIYITFQAERSSLSSRFDIAAMLRDDLLSTLEIENSYIADVELGTEIMRGQGLAWVDNFTVDIIEHQ